MQLLVQKNHFKEISELNVSDYLELDRAYFFFFYL